MDLKRFENKKILLFGKSRAFSMDEFASQLASAKIELCSEFDDGVALVIEGKMMTPYEQNRSEALYEKHSKDVEFVSIDAFEKELAKNVRADTLLMSLKLSRDKARLKSFIQNSTLGDELFFKLLGMYSWRGEDFFENDDNRDVSAAIILRFYQNIERNHNVQYATSGFMHLIAQTSDERLIGAVYALEPLQKNLHVDLGGANRNILYAIAAHKYTPKSVLRDIVKRGDTALRTIIAMREESDGEMQKALFDTNEPAVLEALCVSKNLNIDIVKKLSKEAAYASNMAANIELDDELFEMFFQNNMRELAKNPSLAKSMQKRLLKSGEREVQVELAKNASLDADAAKELLAFCDDALSLELYKNAALDEEEFKRAYENPLFAGVLAYNPNTPKEILLKLADSQDAEVLMGVAKNPGTPVEALYQLQLDARFARAVKENPAFGTHIQQHNIGWDV